MSELLTDQEIDAFIDMEISRLEAYDATRPAGHPYEFDKHSRRVANDMHALAKRMGFPDARAHTLQRVALIHDIGKRSLPVGIWDMDGKPDATVKAQRRRHTSAGVDIVNERFGADNMHPTLELMRDLMAHHHEAMDGSGWMKIPGVALSTEARMLCICDAFDGYATSRPHFKNRDLSIDAVLTRMAVEKKGQFDPEILLAFSAMKKNYIPKTNPVLRTATHAKL